MKKNDLLVMSVVYILTSVIMFYINGLSKQFFYICSWFPNYLFWLYMSS